MLAIENGVILLMLGLLGIGFRLVGLGLRVTWTGLDELLESDVSRGILLDAVPLHCLNSVTVVATNNWNADLGIRNTVSNQIQGIRISNFAFSYFSFRLTERKRKS